MRHFRGVEDHDRIALWTLDQVGREGRRFVLVVGAYSEVGYDLSAFPDSAMGELIPDRAPRVVDQAYVLDDVSGGLLDLLRETCPTVPYDVPMWAFCPFGLF